MLGLPNTISPFRPDERGIDEALCEVQNLSLVQALGEGHEHALSGVGAVAHPRLKAPMTNPNGGCEGKLPLRVPLGRGVGHFWLAYAPGVCLATCRDCSSSRYPCGSTLIHKFGRPPLVAAVR